jgi:hypothetical protein
MTCGLSKYELFILWKLYYKCIWYSQHIDRRDAVKGNPKNELDEYQDAIDDLLKKGFLLPYKAKGRDDVGLNPKLGGQIKELLLAHKNEYKFIIFR